jgi:hypothetical protein
MTGHTSNNTSFFIPGDFQGLLDKHSHSRQMVWLRPGPVAGLKAKYMATANE